MSINIAININYLKSWNGIFKILHLVLGTICVGIIGNEFNSTYFFLFEMSLASKCFFLIVTSTFYIGTFILFASYLISPSAASIIPKTIYEFVYHSIASVLLLAASITMMVEIHKKNIIVFHYGGLLTASICCLINTVLYICSAVMGFSTYEDD